MSTVIKTGPLFDGRADVAAHEFVAELMKVVTDRAKRGVDEMLGRVLKNPTGYYQSRIRAERVEVGMSVNDSDVIYGSWLEGTSRRNKTTRFKGYATFRTVTQQVQREVPSIATDLLVKYVERMN